MRLDEQQAQWIAIETSDSVEELKKRVDMFLEQRGEYIDVLHKRDGILKLSLEEKLQRAQGRLRNIQWEGVTFANPILIASSPLTQSYETIQQYLDQGAAGIVLKSAGDFKVMCKCAREKQESGCQLRMAVPLIGTSGRIVFSTSARSRHCERITLEETQILYDKIKQHYPSAVVIANFGPESEEDFAKLDQLPGDIIEITPRYFRKSYEKPIAESWWTDTSICPQDDQLTPNREKFMEYQKRVFDILQRQLPRIKRPVLYKIVGFDELEVPSGVRQEDLPVKGFTVRDSEKRWHMYSKDGFGINEQCKGAWSGDCLFINNINYMVGMRQRHPDNFFSWSGGIFNAHGALSAILYGAQTVQLCSAIYHSGPSVVGKIVKTLGN